MLVHWLTNIRFEVLEIFNVVAELTRQSVDRDGHPITSETVAQHFRLARRHLEMFLPQPVSIKNVTK